MRVQMTNMYINPDLTIDHLHDQNYTYVEKKTKTGEMNQPKGAFKADSSRSRLLGLQMWLCSPEQTAA